VNQQENFHSDVLWLKILFLFTVSSYKFWLFTEDVSRINHYINTQTKEQPYDIPVQCGGDTSHPVRL